MLAARFLRLIEEEKAGVSEILTLTFTRKAAAEMQERIYSVLLKHSSKPAAGKAVDEFDRASIATLDSFCSGIVRNCCGRFGLSPGFRTDEDAAAALAEDTALDFILQNSSSPQLMEFIRHQRFLRMYGKIFSLI